MSLTIVSEKRLKQILEHERLILSYCLGNTSFMWAATVAGIILDCDFKEATDAAIVRYLGRKI